MTAKSKLAQNLTTTSASLTTADLPQHPSAAFQAASRAFRSALQHLYGIDLKEHGYDIDEGKWFAAVRPASILNNAENAKGKAILPMSIEATVYVTAATPAEVIQELGEKVEQANAWQRKVIHALYLE